LLCCVTVAAGAAWDEAITVIAEARKKQMTAPGLQEPAKKALATLDREWDGLAAHRDYPMIGLDNNPAERALRRPVVTRKNAYGSRNTRTPHGSPPASGPSPPPRRWPA
jgi:transposase